MTNQPCGLRWPRSRVSGSRVSGALVALACGLVLSGCVQVDVQVVDAPADTRVVVADVASRCRTFLECLDGEQTQKATRPLEDAEATTWHFVPGRYVGVEMGMLDRVQKVRALDVVRAMLGASGYARTEAIMALEDVLRERESTATRVAEHRDPGRYALLVCGAPDADGDFVVRFQGHHVSLRVAVVDGVLAAHTPHFLGSNPHRIDDEAFWMPLGDEDELGHRLLAALNDEQRAAAVFSNDAPDDVLLGPAVTIEGKTAPARFQLERGLSAADMDESQQQLLWQLLELYADRLRHDHAAAELARVREAGIENLRFAWAGSAEPGKGHYYRIVGPFFAIEYDCTQNGANHVHTVWRDFERDFGGDPLREHLRAAHGR